MVHKVIIVIIVIIVRMATILVIIVQIYHLRIIGLNPVVQGLGLSRIQLSVLLPREVRE